MSRRTISNDIKEELFVRQFGCCNNRPGNTDTSFSIPGKGKYLCPMWKSNEGRFDECLARIHYIAIDLCSQSYWG